MPQVLAIIFLVVGLLGCAASPPPTPLQATVAVETDVRAALSSQYPYANGIRSGEFQFDDRKTVELVELPALAKALPDVRFYVTQLRTGYYEYPDVEIAVAFPSRGPIAVYLSPVFSKSDPAFVTLLTKAQAVDAPAQRAVAEEIAWLFASITYKGEIRGQQLDHDTYSAELWHGDQYWRRVSIAFTNGRVSSVALENPKKAAQ